MTIQNELISEIKAFLAKNKLSKSAFGLEVMGDYGFVSDIENGRSVQLKTVEKVRAFMKAKRKRKGV